MRLGLLRGTRAELRRRLRPKACGPSSSHTSAWPHQSSHRVGTGCGQADGQRGKPHDAGTATQVQIAAPFIWLGSSGHSTPWSLHSPQP
jgi:hypothetical protein